jgi:hypothetical protein
MNNNTAEVMANVEPIGSTPSTESQEDADVVIQRFLKAHGSTPVTWKELDGVMNDAVHLLLKNHATQIATLKAEIEKLKARPMQKWAGTHIEGTRYSEASLCTRGGSLWCAATATSTTPGTPGSDWRLIVKQPKFRRDEIEDALAAIIAKKEQA